MQCIPGFDSTPKVVVPSVGQQDSHQQVDYDCLKSSHQAGTDSKSY